MTTHRSILDALTTEWQPREDIERKVGGSCMNLLTVLKNEGRILHMVDATQHPWIHKYCLPHKRQDVLIGTSHVGRMASPAWEAAE